MQLKYYWTNYKALIIGGALFILIVVAWSWCSADSSIDLPKAENHAANANIAVREAETEINSADEAAGRADALEQPKREAIKKAANSRRQFDRSNQNFQAKKKEYEDLKSKTVFIDNSNLDERERVLLADLDRLYGANK